MVLLVIHYNLCMGTLAQYLDGRPDLEPLLEELARFDVNGQFMLTEVGHGLDAAHLETTATLQRDGSFELHSPNRQAAKYMPPATPVAGMRRGAIVIARLMVAGEDRGVRPFWVMLNDGRSMEQDVVTRALPRRAGSQGLDHAITMFDRKQLPPTALLGRLDKPANERLHFLSVISRVAVGTMALSMLNIPALKTSAYIAGVYSKRRTITGPDGEQGPIVQFRTQQRPILHAFAQGAVYEAASKYCVDLFTTARQETVRHAVATAFKAAVTSATQESLVQLADRCGAQGLFEHNGIVRTQLLMRGNSIAEGDVLVLSIRLLSELLLGRYALPPSPNPGSLIARYEEGLIDEARAISDAGPPGADGGHRGEHFNNNVLPLALPAVEAIGFRLAYDAAVAHGVPADLLAVFEAGVVLRGASWFAEHLGLARRDMLAREERALSALLPRLDELLEESGVDRYSSAPVLSRDSWERFVDSLPVFEAPPGEAAVESGLQAITTRILARL
ncbi:putative acyl- oxidase protein [Neofusicoccum parvum UCRNP2]|uniref:Putative acyl-oxidase protein n=1 Tax=Botryosphaeria parva (strain UCR-NP2) TaxID=1287680 RepID=R1EA44_BOTPV|nr:putative acyl- oxidase protein [Neofusicoccum parvum UCRNP2]